MIVEVYLGNLTIVFLSDILSQKVSLNRLTGEPFLRSKLLSLIIWVQDEFNLLFNHKYKAVNFPGKKESDIIELAYAQKINDNIVSVAK